MNRVTHGSLSSSTQIEVKMELPSTAIQPAAVVVVALLLVSCCCLVHPTIVDCLPQPEHSEETAEPQSKPACKFPAIFNFGDSNSDTGGLSAAFGQVGSPSGETFFHTPMGRYCDGRLKIDFIAQALGLPYLSAFLDAIGSNFTHGANFATAGSTVRPQNTTLHQSGYSPISLNVQFYEFNDFQRRSQIYRAKGGIFKSLLPPNDYFSSALYTFDIGQNDLTSGYFQNMSTSQVIAYIPDILTQFTSVIKSIHHDKGGRYFWIHNTGPVGCLPYLMDRLLVTPSEIDHVGCSSPYNDVAQHFNRELKRTVMKLRDELPGAAITYVNVYSVMYDLISHARRYGFHNSLRACCGRGGKYNYNRGVGCGGKVKTRRKGKIVTEEVRSCEDPASVINWDGVHYTEAGNKWVFDRIVGGEYSDPPNPLNMACYR